ncbi:MAG: hypothetical protein QXS54_05345, partial [Candidatus Methanomethylicaceae archaeon]
MCLLSRNADQQSVAKANHLISTLVTRSQADKVELISAFMPGFVLDPPEVKFTRWDERLVLCS